MSDNYTADNIQVLEGLEAVRLRPGMYISDTATKGLHHLVYEIVDNAVDEALMDRCSEIYVIIHPDNSISVRDNGHGIPVGIQAQTGLPAVTVVFTVLHAGGKFGTGGYKVSGGLHGVGASAVNALSEWLHVQVKDGSHLYEQKFSRGEVVTDLQKLGETTERGTMVHFLPDTQIFEELEYSFDTLKQRLQEMAFLTKGLQISLVDERPDPHRNRLYRYDGGIREYVAHINRNKDAIQGDIFYCEAKADNVLVEVALQYNESYQENIFSFANNINTRDGGTHLTGFRTALTRTINNYGRKFNLLKEKDKNLSGEDVQEGLTAVISIKLENPQFESQNKVRINNSEARGAVESVLSEHLTYFLEENPNIGKSIIEKSLMAAQAREAARKAREDVRRKSVFDGGRLPGKLVDCSEKDPAKSEIFIVEGDSAGGNSKQARHPEFQAVLPIRGKLMNVEKEKARLDKVLGSNTIKDLISALGTGIREEFDINKLRYHKFVIMTDADVDGSHIRTLILTFLYRYMIDLVRDGYVYIAQPPLYKVEKGKNTYYAHTDKELESVLARIGRDGVRAIQRYKGLAEMSAQLLRETTMDPNNRVLLQVTLDDVIAADEIISQLMGDKAEARREFIEEYGSQVKNLDIV